MGHRLHVVIPGPRTTHVGADARRVVVGPIAADHAPRAADQIDGLVARSGVWRPAAAIVVPSGPANRTSRWVAVVSHMRCPAVLVSRPLAAVSGWGAGAGTTRLIIDRREDGVEITAVGEDGVIAAEHCDRAHPAGIAKAARSVLSAVDPDQEWAIREHGVDVLVEDAQPAWVDDLATLLGIPARVTSDPIDLIWRGVRNDRAVIERCLAAEPRRRPGAPAIGARRSVAWE